MAGTNTSSLITPSYCRSNILPGNATKVQTTVLTSSAIASTTTSIPPTATYKGSFQQQTSQPSGVATSSATCLNKSSSCPDSPIRRVSASLKHSAVGFATRFLNRCRAATFTVDGATYTIVASTPENLTHPTGNNLNTDCNTPQQTGSSINNITQPHLTSDKTAFKNIATATAIRTGTTLPASASAAANVSAAGGDSIGGEEDILNATYPSSVHNTPESICSNSSITNKSFASDINSQVARHGALTIVRRSNSRKSFSQYDTQHLYSAVTAPAPLSSADQNLLDDLKGQSSHDNRRNDTRLYSNTPLLNASAVSSVDNAATKICSSIKTTSTVTQNITKMLPTSPNSTNAAETADDTERTREDLLPCTASGSTIISSMANLTTDDLPAVDTPDACDKAALRLRSLLHMLNTGEIQADVLQKICIMQHES